MDGDRYRFEDNGHYIGHDEPSVKFISSHAGLRQHDDLPDEDARWTRTAVPNPVRQRHRTTRQLSVAPWFGLPMCDPKSYPQNACTPDSDTNTGLNSDPTDAGSAFMELQLYPPGYTPFGSIP